MVWINPNIENRLIQITNLTTGHISQFAYDGLSRRIQITETPKNGTASTVNYLWCNEKPCATFTPQGHALKLFFAQGEYHTADHQALYYAKDHLGSIMQVVNAKGQVLGSQKYTPYGTVISQSGVIPTFGYAGMYQHQPSGLNLTWYRAYNPITARWLSKDPIEEAGGLNLYGYVGGSPLMGIDPMGLAQMCHRTLSPIAVPIARHCYIKYPDGSSNSFAPDRNGDQADPDINKEGTICTDIEDSDDNCLKREMAKCNSANYDFFKFNCCHCTEEAIKKCRGSIPSNRWPNWPINPGPQPYEPYMR